MVFGGLLTSAVAADKLEKRKSPKGAKAYIISPKDGKTVGKKFPVRFGLKGIAVNFVGTRERHQIAEIERYYNCKIEEMDMAFEGLEKQLKELR